MLQKVEMNGLTLPTLYIAENEHDAELAMRKGIPFVKWRQGQDKLVKILLRPVLEKMFPGIKWDKVLGRKRFESIVVTVPGTDPDELGCSGIEPDEESTVLGEDGSTVDDHDAEVVDIADGTRLFHDDEAHTIMPVAKLDLDVYAGDLSSQVNVEVLQKLKLMPQFIGDIIDCIKVNLTNPIHWNEGYNKKLRSCVGNFNRGGQLPNLMILDVSGSIPRGISATMIALIDTLRTETNSDLIITSSHSRFYPAGSELPDPQKIRNEFGYSNESWDFNRILTNELSGKHYGHVFSFGDYDTPDSLPNSIVLNTRVEKVHHYHTRNEQETGYAKWCDRLADKPEMEFDTSWCKVIKKDIDEWR